MPPSDPLGHEPFAQELKLTAPWALITRVEAPEGWVFHNLWLAHNIQSLMNMADRERTSPYSPGYQLRGAYVAGGIIELPIHFPPGWTNPR